MSKPSKTLLCIETSSPTAPGFIGLVQCFPDQDLEEISLPCGRSQGIHLAPAIQDLLQKKQVSLKDLSAIAVSVGPGSFTGVRIGLATAQGLAFAENIPLIGVSSLQTLAYQVSPRSSDILACALMDARKGEIYGALYTFEKGIPKILFAETNAKPEAFCRWLLSLDLKEKEIVFLGDGADLYGDLIESLCIAQKPQWHININKIPRIFALAALACPQISEAKKQAWSTLSLLKPRYLRPEDQEFRIPKR